MEEVLQAKPFVFRRRFERVDWRKLASANLDQIARDLDFNALQENLTNIAFCNVELELDLRLIDPNFVKLFRMGQLTIEYLLYSQEYLSETIMSLEGRVKEQHKNDENLTEKLRIVEKELERLKKEGHKRKKLIMDQQHLIESGADNFHKCLLCPKAFMNTTFLQNHCVRRHGQTFQDIKNTQGDDKEAEIPTKISEQLLEIKERLMFTESQLEEERKSTRELNVKEMSMLADRDAEHMRKLEQWQEMRESQHKQEIERIQNMLMTELREMQEKQTATQRALEAAQGGLVGRASNLGTSIRDDIDVEREMLQREREEVMKLKDQVKIQVDDMQDMVQREVATRDLVQKEVASRERALKKASSKEAAADVQRLQRALERKQEEVNALQDARNEGPATGEWRTKAGTNAATPHTAAANQEQPITNGHSPGTVNGFSGKKKKTLTFAEDSDIKEVSSPSREFKKSAVAEVKELSPSDTTLSSEEYSETEAEDTTLADATSTIQSMSTLGTLDLTANSKLLRDAVIQNPRLMQDMRVQIQQRFNDELHRWDVQPDSEGLSATKLNTKQQHLAQERSKMERKYKQFRETRIALQSKIDELARREITASREKASAPKGGRSPKDNRKLTGTTSSMTATMESSTWGTSSSKWTSSDRREQVPDLPTDDESSEDDDSSPTIPEKRSSMQSVGNTPSPKVQERQSSQSEQSRPSSGWNTVQEVDDGGFAPSAKASTHKPAIKMPGVDNEESDWDEDDLSEVADIGQGTKTATPLRTSTGSTGSTIRASGVIGNLAANIERQLLGRKGKAPVGGVNTLEMPSDDRRPAASPITPDIPKIAGDDDDDFSISSVEAQLMPSGTNTYSSRQWGQGSTGTTLNTSNRPGGDKASITSDNASLTSVTGTAQKGDTDSDWSADSDFQNL